MTAKNCQARLRISTAIVSLVHLFVYYIEQIVDELLQENQLTTVESVYCKTEQLIHLIVEGKSIHLAPLHAGSVLVSYDAWLLPIQIPDKADEQKSVH